MATNIGTVASNKYNDGVSATKKGTAGAAQVLTGYTFTNSSSVAASGTMVNNGAVSKSITPSTSAQTYTIPAGYHNGSGKVTVAAAPTSLIDGDTTAANVLTGKTFFVDSYTKKTGTMANNGAVSQALNCGGSYTIPAGYHNGSGKVTANSLASQTSGTVTAAQILKGKTAWVGGTKLTGTMVDYSSNIQTIDIDVQDAYNGSVTVDIPDGYHTKIIVDCGDTYRDAYDDGYNAGKSGVTGAMAFYSIQRFVANAGSTNITFPANFYDYINNEFFTISGTKMTCIKKGTYRFITGIYAGLYYVWVNGTATELPGTTSGSYLDIAMNSGDTCYLTYNGQGYGVRNTIICYKVS